jgi:predicted acetyltransferase
MPELTICPLHGEEWLDVHYALDAYSFHPSPPLTDKDEWQSIVRRRQGVTYFALFEDGEPVSGAAGTAMTQNVRGLLFPANGVWGVATAPAARRKGYSRRVLAELLAALRAQGQAFSTLYPFRESFYERLGYVSFPLPKTARFSPLALEPVLDVALEGEVEMGLIADGFEVYQDFLGRLQARMHGMARFVYPDFFTAQRNRAWLARAVVDGEPAGLMLYYLRGEDPTQFLLRAYRFYTLTSQGRHLLLQWIARHIDQANAAELWLAPFEQPELWLADLGVKVEAAERAPMARVLDVAKLAGLPAGAGRFTARVHDPLCPWNEGVWCFESAGGVLQVRPGGEPECSLSIQALAALAYGTHDPGDFALRGWGDPSMAVQAVMRAMFPPLTPYLHEYF